MSNRAERRSGAKKNARQAGKTKQMKQILACPPKPDFKAVAADIVMKSKSPFTDEDWLAGTIANELKEVWETATRTEAERIHKQLVKQGRMDIFGKWTHPADEPPPPRRMHRWPGGIG